MYKIIVVITTALIGLTSSIALPAQFLAPALTQEKVPEITTEQNAKTVPIAVYQVKIAIPAGTLIGKAKKGWFGGQQEWHIEEIGNNTLAFVDRIGQAMKKAGYTLANPPEGQTRDNDSVFSNINRDYPQQPSSQARFLVGATITKTWMTARDNGWGSWVTDVDMKVTWEVYDTWQNQVILTQETYAIDVGGGMTVTYYYTVMEKAAAQFFNSPEFKKAIEKSLAYHPEPALPIPTNSQ